jgi:DNA-binding response OmpR family regulator
MIKLSKDLKVLSKSLDVLYVEDDKYLQEKTRLLLDTFFASCKVANDGVEALKYYDEYYEQNGKYFDIVISDIQMPNKNGIELSKEITQRDEEQAIIIVSAYDDSHYLIDLINLGVGYFITKPFTSDKFIEILYKCCQRIKDIEADYMIKFSEGYKWDKDSLSLYLNDEQIKLSKYETAIFNLMILNPNQIFSSEMLFNTMYYDDVDKDMSIDSIKSIIKRLRKKLPADMIESIYSQGYRINPSCVIYS